MNSEKESIHPEIIYVDSQKENVYVEAALQWCSDVYSDNILGFANNIRTVDGAPILRIKNSFDKNIQ